MHNDVLPHRQVTFACESKVYGLDATLTNWTSLVDSLREYIELVNEGPLGKIAPDVVGLYELYRRSMQTQLFVDLGVASKESYNFGLVLNPLVNGEVAPYAIPIQLPTEKVKGMPPVYYTTFEYSSWGSRHDELLNTPGPSISSAFDYGMISRVDHEFLDSFGLSIELVEGGVDGMIGESMDEFSTALNSLYLANIQKYATSKGPHFYNMPMIQATMFDQDLNANVYSRYVLTHRNHKILGYFIVENCGDSVTISHALMDKSAFARMGFSIKYALSAVLTEAMRRAKSGRVIKSSRLIDRYLLN